MPEGHVVHRQSRHLGRAMSGDPVQVTSPQGRFAAGATTLDGQVLERADAYGKHLLLSFGAVGTIHVHLGLFGKWTFGKGLPPDPVGQIRLRLVTASAYADLRGPTACEVLDPTEVSALIARIGPDPIRPDADPERAWARVEKSRTSIAALLMDQTVFAGVGNIYRAEVLFRAGLWPHHAGRDIGRAVFDEMWADLIVLMRDGVRRGRIDTVRREHLPSVMGRSARRDRHGGEVYVYRRAGQDCHLCGEEVSGAELLGRSLFWCPGCQRP